MFSTSRTDKDQNNFEALLPQKTKSDPENSRTRRPDDRPELYGSPLISSSPYRNPEFHDTFDLHNPSNNDNFDFKLPISPGLDPMHHDFSGYNRFGSSHLNSGNTEKPDNHQQDPFADENDMLEPITIFSRLSSKLPESDRFLLNSPKVSPIKPPTQSPTKVEKDSSPYNQNQKALQGLGNGQNEQIKKIEKPVQLFLKNGP